MGETSRVGRGQGRGERPSLAVPGIPSLSLDPPPDPPLSPLSRSLSLPSTALSLARLDHGALQPSFAAHRRRETVFLAVRARAGNGGRGISGRGDQSTASSNPAIPRRSPRPVGPRPLSFILPLRIPPTITTSHIPPLLPQNVTTACQGHPLSRGRPRDCSLSHAACGRLHRSRLPSALSSTQVAPRITAPRLLSYGRPSRSQSRYTSRPPRNHVTPALLAFPRPSSMSGDKQQPPLVASLLAFGRPSQAQRLHH